MNCAKLNQDITRLQALRDELAQKVDELNDNMHGKIEAKKAQEEIREAEDQILESYLTDFEEKNPDLFGWMLRERIEGFEDKDGYTASICSIAQLPDGGMLVGGQTGALYECRKNADGEWGLGKRIEGFEDKDGYTASICSIAQLPDGGMLVGGDGGVLYVCRKDADGKWGLRKRIEGFENKDGYAVGINSIAQLPDGGMLVGGSDRGALLEGVLYECRKNADGEWGLGKRIEGFKDKDGYAVGINSIAQLPDGGMLVGGSGGALYECRKNADGEWRLKKRIEGFKNEASNIFNFYSIDSIAQLPDGGMLVGGSGGALFECRKNADGEWGLGQRVEGFECKDRYTSGIYSIAQLPDGRMLVGGSGGALYECRKNADGEWRLKKRIEGFKDKDGYAVGINSIAQLPDGRMLVGGSGGALYELNHLPLSVDTIKNNLDILAEGAK